MKRALTILASLILVGCANDEAGVVPTAPGSLTGSRTVLRGTVVNESGECIRGATVQVLAGKERAGEEIEQKLACSNWYRGSNPGFTIADVQVGVELTIRSSAPGYASEDVTIVPTQSPVSEVLLTLRRNVELRSSDR